jgi:hypothetical protein
VRFKGRIGRKFAKIPAGGKLYELQVRRPDGAWTTVGQARKTNGSGRFTFKYRFTGIYTIPVTFKFRVRVIAEPTWPYAAPKRSNAQKVTVMPK